MLTAKEMKSLLDQNLTTSVELVKNAIKQHEKWMSKNAIAQISPLAIEIAIKRDQERHDGYIRGPLHGIPLLIKDNILYKDGTLTTANAYALSDLYPPYHATIVEKLIQSGAIILGKANLSEFAYFMSYDNMPSGYGSMYGQVKHPFDEKIDPYGSSTGSAVAVKLGIVPFSIGTETNGSLMAPAYQCQITSYKPSFGLVSKFGIIPISPTQDTAGPMAQTVYDCAMLMDALNKEDPKDSDTLNLCRPNSFLDQIDLPLSHQKIGCLFLENRAYQDDELKIISQSKERLIALGHEVIDIKIDHSKVDNDQTLLIEFKYAMNAFLKSMDGYTKMKSLDDIIKFNLENKDRCLKFGQSILEKSNETSGDLTDSTYLELRNTLLNRASLLEELMQKHKLDAIMAPLWMGFAPIYGNPSICIPEGIYSNIPKAMVFVGKKYDDLNLLRLTHQYQKKCEINS